jgi:hypothetical protein
VIDKAANPHQIIDGCDSVKFVWINKHTILLWLIQDPAQVMSWCNRFVPVRPLFQHSNCKDIFLKNTVSFHCQTLPGISFLLNLPEMFRDIFPDSGVPNKSTVSPAVNRFRDKETLYRVVSDPRKRVNACIAERGGHFQRLIHYFCFLISV